MIKAIWFGRTSYMNGLSIQKSIIEKMKTSSNSCDYLCLFEHSPVYTVGLRQHVYSAEEEKRLTNFGADFHRIRRGGLITFHGPGQLVGYPLLNLRQLHVYDEEKDTKVKVGVRIFVNLVEQVIIDLVSKSFKIGNVGRTKDTGVWISDERKIAAIGIQVSSGITSHGFALNCCTDLSWFENILPCGLEGKTATSISQELNRIITVENVLEPLMCQFKMIFQLPVELRKTESDLHNVSKEKLSAFLESAAFQRLL